MKNKTFSKKKLRKKKLLKKSPAKKHMQSFFSDLLLDAIELARLVVGEEGAGRPLAKGRSRGFGQYWSSLIAAQAISSSPARTASATGSPCAAACLRRSNRFRFFCAIDAAPSLMRARVGH